jgi:transcriptional regulator with XRE-family HTH domain
LSKIPRGATKGPVGQRIKQARERVGHSQRGLGRAIELDESVAGQRINHYEQELNSPGFGIVNKIAGVTGVPTSYFYEQDDQLAEVIVKLGALNSAGLERVSAYLSRLPRSVRKIGTPK